MNNNCTIKKKAATPLTRRILAKTIRGHDGVCLSHSVCKILLWIFIPSLIYTVASLTWLLVRFFGG